jgi:hypothetical protein
MEAKLLAARFTIPASLASRVAGLMLISLRVGGEV